MRERSHVLISCRPARRTMARRGRRRPVLLKSRPRRSSAGFWLVGLLLIGVAYASSRAIAPIPAGTGPAVFTQEQGSQELLSAPPGAATPAVIKERRYVTAGSLNVRASPSTQAMILHKLARGAEVGLTGAEGDWTQIALADGSTGWVSTRFLDGDPPAAAAEAVPPKKLVQEPAAPAIDRSAIVRALIAESQAAYPGNCPCPENRMRNGRRCGGNSAWSKGGGYSPLCYPSDVTEAMIQRHLARR